MQVLCFYTFEHYIESCLISVPSFESTDPARLGHGIQIFARKFFFRIGLEIFVRVRSVVHENWRVFNVHSFSSVARDIVCRCGRGKIIILKNSQFSWRKDRARTWYISKDPPIQSVAIPNHCRARNDLVAVSDLGPRCIYNRLLLLGVA